MDHFLYSHYNPVSDQASYKNSCFFEGWGFIGLFPLYLVLLTIYDYFYYSYTFLKYC